MIHAKDLEDGLALSVQKIEVIVIVIIVVFQNPSLDSLQVDRESSNLVAHHSRPCLPFQSPSANLIPGLPSPGLSSLRVGADHILLGHPGTGSANSRWLTKALLL